jgi:hypothetical protein
MNREYNFIHKDRPARDRDELLGPLDPTDPNDEVHEFDDSWCWAHVMAKIGVFKSVSEARKNGWNRPFKQGFQQETVTKNKILVTVLNKSEWM